MVFLLPSVAFLGSLAFGWSKRFGWWFCGLGAAHLALFLALPFAFSSYETRVAWLSVNELPWYPFREVQLPVTLWGWLTLPEAAADAWCVAAWVLLYGLLAMALTRLTSHLQLGKS